MATLSLQVVSSLDRDELVVEITVESDDEQEHRADVRLEQSSGHLLIDLHGRPTGHSWTFDLRELQAALERAGEEAMTFAKAE